MRYCNYGDYAFERETIMENSNITINCWYCGGLHHSEDCRDHKANIVLDSAGSDLESEIELLYYLDEHGA